MVKLSAVIITYNEEKNIGRCIDSLKDVADEIVVVDSYSKDRTEEICRERGARFMQHEFEGHIEQKNFALSQVTYDHVLSIDADEALSDSLSQSMLKIKGNWTHDGYYMTRLNYYCGKWIRHGGWYPDRKLRLIDRRKGKWAGLNPHDRFVLNDVGTTGSVSGDLLHYSYYTINGHLAQTHNFSSISAKAMYADGARSNLFKILVNPTIKFLKDYFIKLGFLDGYYGLVISVISSYATFLKYSKLKQLSGEARK